MPNAINSNYENDYRLSNFVSGTNYLAPNGSAISLTNFPTLNQNTTGTASNIIATSNNTLTSLPNLNITQSQVANLVTDLSNKQNNLVSGSNIKTVFGNSLLGSSNLTFTQNDILDGTTNRTFTDVEKTKLANITPIVATTTADYFRGDKTFQPSTSLPISMATQTALDLKDNDYTVTKKVTWDVNATTGGLWIGNSGNGQGVFQALWSTVFNKYTLWNRSRYSNVVTTLNQQLGQICTNNSFSLQTGYKFFATAGFDTWTNGGRIFIGTTQSINSIASEPSSFNNTIGFQSNTTDNGLIYFGTRDGATINRVSTGFTVSNNSGYIFQYNVLPNATSVSYKITDINTGLTNSGVLTTNLPSLTTIVTAKVLASNGNLTAVNSIQIGVNSIVLEHNY